MTTSLSNGFEESLAAPGEDCGRAFDRDWASQVFQRASLELQTALCGEGKQVYFEVFRTCVLESGGNRPNYEYVGRSLGLKASDVGHYLREARRIFRLKVIAAVQEYLVDADDLATELRIILGPQS